MWKVIISALLSGATAVVVDIESGKLQNPIDTEAMINLLPTFVAGMTIGLVNLYVKSPAQLYDKKSE